jgi:hypothetical protein
LRTHWELERNMLGTKEKWKKSSPYLGCIYFIHFRVSLG